MASTRAGQTLTWSHRAAQLQIAASVEQIIRKAWPMLDPRNLDATVQIWTEAMLPIVMNGRQRSIQAAMQYLSTFSALETGKEMVLATPAGPPLKAAETSLRVTGPVAIKALVGNGMPLEQATSTALSLVAGAMKRHAMSGGISMIEESVAADPDAVGWRRIGDGDSCKFCRMLIGKGEVYSAKTATFASHDGCGCSAEPAYGGPAVSVEQYTASKRHVSDADRKRLRDYLAQMD